MSLVVSGTAGTGAKWMNHVSNSDVVSYVEQHYISEAENGESGGPFRLKLDFTFSNPGESEVRLAYARPWEFDSDLFKSDTPAWIA